MAGIKLFALGVEKLGFIWDLGKILFLLLTLLGLAFENYIPPFLVAISIFLYTILRGIIRSTDGIRKSTYILIETIFILFLFIAVIGNQGSIIEGLNLFTKLIGSGFNMISDLVISGYLDTTYLIIFGGSLLFFWAFGKHIGSRMISKTFTIFLPLTALIIFIGVNSRDFNTFMITFTSILPIIIIFIGLYFIVFSIFKTNK